MYVCVGLPLTVPLTAIAPLVKGEDNSTLGEVTTCRFGSDENHREDRGMRIVQ